MTRFTTDNPSSNVESYRNMVIIKDKEVYLRGMGEDNADLNLCDYVRQNNKDYAEYDNETLMDVMCDEIMDPIQMVYWLAVGFAETRRELQSYENTDLDPEQITEQLAALERALQLRSDPCKVCKFEQSNNCKEICTETDYAGMKFSAARFTEKSRESINVQIGLHKSGDGGIACMPLQRNIPNPQRDDWKPAVCPKCPADCWETAALRELRRNEKDVTSLCTECALRVGTGGTR